MKKQDKKAELQKYTGLTEAKDKLLVGVVGISPLDGAELIAYMLDEICKNGIQLIVIGCGNSRFEELFQYYSSRSPDFYYDRNGRGTRLEEMVFEACDALLVPSLSYDPEDGKVEKACRNGCIPIVRHTGVLKDRIIMYNEYTGTGNGFVFTNYNAHDMLGTIRYAGRIFFDRRPEWNRLAARARKSAGLDRKADK